MANADGTEERKLAARKLPEFFLSPAWSPDGKRLACAGYRRDGEGPYSDIVEMAIGGGEQKSLTYRRWGWVGNVVWLSDGSAPIVTANETTDNSNLLWRISYPGGESRRITTDLSEYTGLSVTADSSAIVSTQRSGAIVSLYIQAGEDSASAARLTSGTARMDGWNGMSWTPNGKIVYSSVANASSSEIWIMDPDGANQKQLTAGLGSFRFGLSVSPDRKYVFVSNTEDVGHVWRVDIDGGNPKQLTQGPGEFNPFITPGGKWVIYQDGAKHCSKVLIYGGEPVQLTSPLSDIVPRGYSPDGKLIAYMPSKAEGEGKKLWIASSEGGAPIKIIDLPPGSRPRGMQWKPDGKAITYIESRRGGENLWMQPLNGSPPKPLTNFREYFIHTFSWSPDGKYLVMSRGFQTGDVVLINSVK